MTSNADLEAYLCRYDSDELHALIQLLCSRLSPESGRLASKYSSAGEVPGAGTNERSELCRRVVALLGWYGSNSIAYAWRRAFHGDGGKPYLGVLRDVVHLVNRRLPRKQRQEIPLAGGVQELEQKAVELLLALRFHDKKTEEIVQILEESGLEAGVAKDVALRYGPAGLAGAGLPILTKFLGKKTVMTIVQQILVGFVGRVVGKEAALQMAKRLAVKITQKMLTRLINSVAWAWLAVDVTMFVAAPARRITIKAVPFVALCRVRDRLAEEKDGEQ